MPSPDPHGHHDWHSREYVEDWIARDDSRNEQRNPVLRRVVSLMPYPVDAEIRVLDVGAGYGALSEHVLERFPRARLVCQDYSEPMFAHARERLGWADERVLFVLSDQLGWLREAGLAKVKCFWEQGRTAIIGGLKPA